MRGPKKIINTAADAALVARRLCRAEQETFVVVLLDVRNQLISAHVVAIGTVHSVEVHPRDVFREAVKRNAAGIVVAHNHPSGDPTPSAEDFAITERLRTAGEILGIPMVDHVVVTATGAHCSIAEITGDGAITAVTSRAAGAS